MYRVALNTAISSLRNRSKRPVLETLSADQIADRTNQENEQRDLMFQAISQLNDIDKAIVLLWLEGERYEEIARILGITKSNVSVKLVRIKRELEKTVNQSSK